jgi:small-conductance mechanosensitive channel
MKTMLVFLLLLISFNSFSQNQFDELQKAQTNKIGNELLKKYRKYGPSLLKTEEGQNLFNEYIQAKTGEVVVKNIESKEDVSFGRQVEEILMPGLQSLKELSQRPRRIQFLKNKITREEEYLESWEKVQEKYTKDEDKKRVYKIVKPYIDKNIKEVSDQLDEHRFQLFQLENQKGSLIGNVSTMVFNFFKTKGKNLLIALFVAFLFLWSLSFVKRQIVKSIQVYLQRRNMYVKHQWVLRPTRVILGFLVLCFSLFAAIVTLYALNDWILVTIILLFLVGIAWSSKHALAQIFEQAKILLNFGAIREGERVEFNGIGWKVKKLGIYSTFENPWLSNASIRVNAKKFQEMVSRPVNENEPWFPTEKGDWVELDDSVFGKVIYQSPQYVIIKQIGGHEKTYPTSTFLSLNPVNLSHDFGVEIIFGVDYSHQKELTNTLLSNFRANFKDKLDHELGENTNKIKNIDISIHAANTSSLDLRIFLHCEGEMAPYKQLVERESSKVAIEICNEFKYIIPFNQLTVHMQQ